MIFKIIIKRKKKKFKVPIPNQDHHRAFLKTCGYFFEHNPKKKFLIITKRSLTENIDKYEEYYEDVIFFE